MVEPKQIAYGEPVRSTLVRGIDTLAFMVCSLPKLWSPVSQRNNSAGSVDIALTLNT